MTTRLTASTGQSSALADSIGEFLVVLKAHFAEAEFGKLPPPVRVPWHLIGKCKYRRYITSVRGGAAHASKGTTR